MGLFSFSRKPSSLLSAETVIAADRGDPAAKQQLYDAFDHGLTDNEYNAIRRRVYYPLANQGDPVAQYWMGFLSQQIDKDMNNAKYWFEQSANQGNFDSMRALAFGYSEFANTYSDAQGFGFNENMERFWKQKAAQMGDAESQADLALDYVIAGDTENALLWYQLASDSSNLKVAIKALMGLAHIYGERTDLKHYDKQKQKDCLIRVLTMKQNNLYDLNAYDEDNYRKAAFELGCAFKIDYEATGNGAILKYSVYCFVLAATLGDDFARSLIDQYGYVISNNEFITWQGHANSLSFYLPK